MALRVYNKVVCVQTDNEERAETRKPNAHAGQTST